MLICEICGQNSNTNPEAEPRGILLIKKKRPHACGNGPCLNEWVRKNVVKHTILRAVGNLTDFVLPVSCKTNWVKCAIAKMVLKKPQKCVGLQLICKPLVWLSAGAGLQRCCNEWQTGFEKAAKKGGNNKLKSVAYPCFQRWDTLEVFLNNLV